MSLATAPAAWVMSLCVPPISLNPDILCHLQVRYFKCFFFNLFEITLDYRLTIGRQLQSFLQSALRQSRGGKSEPQPEERNNGWQTDVSLIFCWFATVWWIGVGVCTMYSHVFACDSQWYLWVLSEGTQADCGAFQLGPLLSRQLQRKQSLPVDKIFICNYQHKEAPIQTWLGFIF